MELFKTQFILNLKSIGFQWRYNCPHYYQFNSNIIKMVSFGKSVREGLGKKGGQMPGPGQYTSITYVKSTPAFRIGTGQRAQSAKGTRDRVPGPGQYSLGGFGNGQSGPKYTLRCKPKIGGIGYEGKGTQIPGPGQYQVNSPAVQKNIAYSFGIKTTSYLDRQSAQAPGPGQYNVALSQSPSREGNGFGTERRAVGGASARKGGPDTPGPGMYYAEKINDAPAIGFGTSRRSQDQSAKKVPGPGQYYDEQSNKIGKNAPMVSMKFRPQSAQVSSQAPGPGQYNPDVSGVKNKMPSSRIGTAKRSGMEKQQDLPGPGTFNVSYDWRKLRQHPGFGTSNRGDVAAAKTMAPGPGNYNPLEMGKSKPPAFSMGIKTGGKNFGDKSPGPGQYNPKIDYAKENLGSVRIGTGTRDQGSSVFTGKDMPGPGQYTLGTSLSGPAFGVGTSMRDGGGGGKGEVPGPGSYRLPTHIANLPKYIMPDRPDHLRFL
ncbi:hypothetical protein FGO68_gene8366 [Halteria grandinella]|uniref:Uncharacterized protein n=1 Tax=Halteria grandinella TaxID=5974 RepID=A0A8J8T3U6_HALGN|nr:hypothetical protein FGO68_gene8366 [Halteria grandinella]